jgi:alpha-L-arabinofuranosidase
VHGEDDHTLTLFALNRSLDEEMPLSVNAKGFAGMSVERATTLHHDDLGAVNTKDAQNKVAPAKLGTVKVDKDTITAKLPPASWNVIRLARS